jgi:hypothetical protein
MAGVFSRAALMSRLTSVRSRSLPASNRKRITVANRLAGV